MLTKLQTRGLTAAQRPLRLAPARPPHAAPSRPLPRPPCYTSPTATESTDLDVEAQDPRDLGVYVYGPSTALHVGFQGPGWRMRRDAATGYVYSLVDFCSPGRVRLAFGAAAGADDDGEVVYTWGRDGWGSAGQCLSNSLGDEKPRFYLTARQAAELLAAPEEEHRFEFKFIGWRGDGQGCPIITDESAREDGVTMTKVLTWRPVTAPHAAKGHGPTTTGRHPHPRKAHHAAGAAPTAAAAPKYELTLALACGDGFSAETRVILDAADALLFRECVQFALPHLLGLHGAFRLPVREDYAQDGV